MWFQRLWIIFTTVAGAYAVSRPPTIIQQPPKTATFVVQESQMLPCTADGEPAPKYTWYKNGKYFNTAGNSGRYSVWPGIGTLIFVRPQEDDDGYYQCVATNQFGESLSVKTNLRRAEFASFSNRAVTVKVKRGTHFELNCERPTTYPPPKISWQFIDGGVTKTLIEDGRHAMDINGNLLFANAQLEDNGRQFFCVANVELIGREESSKPFTIQVSEQSNNLEFPVKVMFTSPKELIGLVNDTASFLCIFSGNPTPTITWEFVNNDYERTNIETIPNVRVDQGGVRMVISPVMPLHQGFYRCSGVNTQATEKFRDFTLTVKSRPYWIRRPTNVMSPPGSTHTFYCEAGGNPKPRIVWYVNGKSADEVTNARKRIDGNKFIFRDLVTADTAVVQCNASNIYGYVFADAYINVVKEPPTFIHKMEPLTRRAEDQSVTLNCSTYSAPEAVTKWTRVDRQQQLTGGRYEISPNGNLRIPKVMISDTGLYRCEASNPFGKIVTEGRLVVRRRTKITLAPQDVRVYENSEVKFVCAGSTDPLEWKNLRVTWLKDGQPIDLARETRVLMNKPDNSIIIGGVRPQDTGSYTCIVTNGIDNATASASLTVQGRPEQPQNIMVNCAEKKAQRVAIVSWKAGPDNSAPILNYEIEFAVITSPETWYTAEVAVPQDSGDKTDASSTTSSAEVRMRPGHTYRFRVRSRNIVGLSEPSLPGKTTCEVPPSAPTSNPTDLWAEGTQPDNIIVHWTPMSEFETNGEELRYIVTIRCLDCDGMADNLVNTTTISNWRDTNVPFIKSIFVSGRNYQVEKYKKYEVTIRSKNVHGESTKSALKAVGYSGEAQPSIKVSGVQVVPNSAKSLNQNNQVTLRFQPPANINSSKDVNGFFRGYRVEWCDRSLSEDACDRTRRYQDHILYTPKHPLSTKYRRRRSTDDFLERMRRATDPVQVTLQRLAGSASLKAWVRVLNKRYAGPMSEAVFFDTATGVPGPVESFKLKTKGVTHLTFQWGRPTQTNGNLTGYQMGVQMISALDLGYLKRFPEINNPNILEGEVVGLKPKAQYRVYIWPRTVAGYGVPNFIDVSTSPANIAPGSPTIRVDSVGKTTVNVTYAPSQKGIPGSVFYVQYRLPGRNKWEESQREFAQRWVLVSELPTDTVYELRVVATNGAGLTSFSETVLVQTGGSGGANQLSGAAGTWFIIIICLLLLFIGGIVGLFYLRKRRFQMLGGKPVPQEDPDKLPHGPTVQPGTQPPPMQLQPAVGYYPVQDEKSAIGPHYQNVPYQPGGEGGSLAPSSTADQPPPLYSDVQRHSPPEGEEWSRPAPSRRRMPPNNGSREHLDRYGSPAPSSGAGATVNPSSTII